MYIDDNIVKRKSGNYRRVLLRNSYRKNGKVGHKTFANLSHCSNEEIEAIKIALKYKKDLVYLEKLTKGKVTVGKIVGAVFAIYQIAEELGIKKALGTDKEGLYAMWLIIARLIDQGSRISAVRLAKIHAGCEIIGIDKLNEEILYKTMDWLYDNKDKIERKLFIGWEKEQSKKKHIFLYDVTSSYFEGTENELAEYGYNRDGKKGKKQIVYGLLTDEDGKPLSIEVFKGNTTDNKTVSVQIEKIKNKFGCKYITFVGDKGMIKTDQIKDLTNEKFFHITSITKDQINSLLKKEILQIGLFDEDICEVEDKKNEVRYIFRRNFYRAKEIKSNRNSKINSIMKRMTMSNQYLKEHKKASIEVQERELKKYIEKLKMKGIVNIRKVKKAREMEIHIDEIELEEKSKLDGCYVIRTNLPKKVADKELVHNRYKALAKVEWAFRTSKSYLDARPIYVRKEKRTIAHLLVVMLSYKIENYLRKSWVDMDITVSEGIKHLSKITCNIMNIEGSKLIRIPNPDNYCDQLLKKINVKIPDILPYREVKVDTRKKLTTRRKSS